MMAKGRLSSSVVTLSALPSKSANLLESDVNSNISFEIQKELTWLKTELEAKSKVIRELQEENASLRNSTFNQARSSQVDTNLVNQLLDTNEKLRGDCEALQKKQDELDDKLIKLIETLRALSEANSSLNEAYSAALSRNDTLNTKLKESIASVKQLTENLARASEGSSQAMANYKELKKFLLSLGEENEDDSIPHIVEGIESRFKTESTGDVFDAESKNNSFS